MQNFLAVNEYRFTLAQKEGKWNLTVVFYNGNNCRLVNHMSHFFEKYIL